MLGAMCQSAIVNGMHKKHTHSNQYAFIACLTPKIDSVIKIIIRINYNHNYTLLAIVGPSI